MKPWEGGPLIIDVLVKSHRSGPAAGTGVQGIYKHLKILDSGIRRNDRKGHFQAFCETIIITTFINFSKQIHHF